MKTIKFISSLLLLGLLFNQCADAQSQPKKPVITKKYTNDQIRKMIDANIILNSRDVQPTAELSKKFQADFPQARDIEWEEAANIYEVEFETGKTDYKAYYDSDANLLMYKYDISISSLPQNVKKAVTEKYPNYRFEDAKKIELGTETIYKVEVERRDVEIKLIVKSNGTIEQEYFDY